MFRNIGSADPYITPYIQYLSLAAARHRQINKRREKQWYPKKSSLWNWIFRLFLSESSSSVWLGARTTKWALVENVIFAAVWSIPVLDLNCCLCGVSGGQLWGKGFGQEVTVGHRIDWTSYLDRAVHHTPLTLSSHTRGEKRGPNELRPLEDKPWVCFDLCASNIHEVVLYQCNIKDYFILSYLGGGRMA